MFRSRQITVVALMVLAILTPAPVARAGQPVTQTLKLQTAPETISGPTKPHGFGPGGAKVRLRARTRTRPPGVAL
jgi:hypothetical protein